MVDTINTRPLTDKFGVELEVADFDELLSIAATGALRNLVDDAYLVLIRGVSLSEEDHIRLAEKLGPIEKPVESSWTSRSNPAILRLGNVDLSGNHLAPTDPMSAYAREAENWHSDGSFKPVPNYITVLHSLEIPPAGGETWFATMVGAFAALPTETRVKLRAMEMEHPYPHNEKKISEWRGQSIRSTTHPVVRKLPNGSEALFLSNRGKIIGLAEGRNSELIKDLFAHATQKPFKYEHQWREHDTLLWNNRALIHQAQDYDGRFRRLLQRLEVAAAA